MGQGIQEWTKETLWKTAFKIEVIWSAQATLLKSHFGMGVLL